MRALIFCIIGVGMAACSNPVANYAEATEEQQAKIMASHVDDMNRVFSRANKQGHVVTIVTGDAAKDTIVTRMKMDIEMPRGGSMPQSMFDDMMLEDSCKEWVNRDFLKAGITMTLTAVDANDRKIFTSTVSPEKCAKFQ